MSVYESDRPPAGYVPPKPVDRPDPVPAPTPAFASKESMGFNLSLDVEVDPSDTLARMAIGWMKPKAITVSVIPGRNVAVVVTYMPTPEQLAMICPQAAKLIMTPTRG